jgi:hypothetical protein
VSIEFDDFRKIVINCIKFKILFPAPFDSFRQSFAGAASPENEFIAITFPFLEIFNTSERKVYIPGFVAQCLIDIKKEQDEVFHSLRHTSVTYKLKLSDGDIKAVQGDSGHAQADMVTEVYGHIIDEDRRKNAERMEKKIRLPYRRE